MTNEALKREIFDEILRIAELDDDEARSFPYDSPLFEGHEVEGKPCLNLDSLMTLELVVIVMEKYGVKIEDADIRSLTTVDAIAEYIERKQAG